MDKTIQELKELITYYGGDLHATIALKQAIEIIIKNKGE